jgi:hypothetical protein
MDTFSSAPASRRIRNSQSVRDEWGIQILALAIFLIVFGAHMNVLNIMKVKIFELININVDIAIHLIIFGVHMNILFIIKCIIKLKILTLINWSYRYSQVRGVSSLE